MQISWQGHYTVKIIAKEAVVVLDPYAPSVGLVPFRAKADIVALSNPSEPSMSHLAGVNGAALVIDTPGEYSVRGFSLHSFGWQSEDGGERAVMRWDIEGVTLLHVGALNRKLTEAELAHINQTDIDILLVPVGGGGALNTKEALDLVSTIEPRMVIPIHYKLPGMKESLETADTFAKEMGAASTKPEKKVIVRSGRLPHDDVQTAILRP